MDDFRIDGTLSYFFIDIEAEDDVFFGAGCSGDECASVYLRDFKNFGPAVSTQIILSGKTMKSASPGKLENYENRTELNKPKPKQKIKFLSCDSSSDSTSIFLGVFLEKCWFREGDLVVLIPEVGRISGVPTELKTAIVGFNDKLYGGFFFLPLSFALPLPPPLPLCPQLFSTLQ